MTQTQQDTAARTPPAGRGLRIALAVSLALNLLVVGLVAGAWLGRDRDRRPDTAMADIGLGPFIQALPGDERRAFGKALIERAGNLRQNREELRQQFDVLLDALRAEPFEIDAVRKAIDAQKARLDERLKIGEELLYERLETMSPEERAGFADALARGLKRKPRFRPDPPPQPKG
ncbi:periplasmic heavy metal sensor [Frigidibacter sp. ROC022]|uniref:periplasmic heavy metal sensor n=1 Tax=Frigidibacter sp. ROC022 TaxID=2971796 RepID=UPI00215B3572|nr:periplasmic heavy metal sensor [Frigidibacter sp. ROC022]MCR8725450.1 periplasmic heavy metal sensor [Frigidibacter sp. ROC022]